MSKKWEKLAKRIREIMKVHERCIASGDGCDLYHYITDALTDFEEANKKESTNPL